MSCQVIILVKMYNNFYLIVRIFIDFKIRKMYTYYKLKKGSGFYEIQY